MKTTRTLRGRRDLSAIDRLEMQSYTNPVTGCRLMTKAPTTDGYVQIRVDGRLVLAHRFAFENAGGTIPEGYELDHTCSNRLCINPGHLEVVTHAENIRRSWARGRRGPSRRKLNLVKANEIRAKHASGDTQAKLAYEYRVSPATISCIIAGKTWAPNDTEVILKAA